MKQEFPTHLPSPFPKQELELLGWHGTSKNLWILHLV